MALTLTLLRACQVWKTAKSNHQQRLITRHGLRLSWEISPASFDDGSYYARSFYWCSYMVGKVLDTQWMLFVDPEGFICHLAPIRHFLVNLSHLCYHRSPLFLPNPFSVASILMLLHSLNSLSTSLARSHVGWDTLTLTTQRSGQDTCCTPRTGPTCPTASTLGRGPEPQRSGTDSKD